MNIGNKFTLFNFKNFMSENRLNNGGTKTTLDQSAVGSSDKFSAGFNLEGERTKNKFSKFKKTKKVSPYYYAAKKESIDLRKDNPKHPLSKLLNLL